MLSKYKFDLKFDAFLLFWLEFVVVKSESVLL